MVGKSVTVIVFVGVNKSAPIAVTVGVKVIGVAVEVENTFCVGMGVSLAGGVWVGMVIGAGAVGVTPNWGRLIAGKPEQAASKSISTKI